MAGHHFISYSAIEAQDFAVKLYHALLAGPESFSPWLDMERLRPGEDWDERLAEAIRTCKSLLFVMTPDSVDSQSVVNNEWTRALKYKKPVIPLLLNRNAEMPFRLGSRQYIDFTGSFDVGLARLRERLRWLDSPEGELQTLKDRLDDAEYDLQRTSPEQRGRVQAEIDTLKEQIVRQERVAEDPVEEETRVSVSIERGIKRERQPEEPVGGTTRTKFINPPPVVAPNYFQDRHSETEIMGDFLKDDALRLMTVVGRGGIGKTAMVCRVLKSLENGRLPDDGGELSVDGIVYLSELGSRRVSVPYVYADSCQLLPDEVAEELDKIYKDPQASIEAKMHALLDAFPEGRYVLLLDSFEDVIEATTREIGDAELRRALRTLLEHPHHAVKVILTSRIAPRDLALVRPELQSTLDLNEGIPSSYAQNMLREMDTDGTVGLRTAPDKVLAEAVTRTRGFPRALEALFAILSVDRDTTLREVLDDTEALLPEHVVDSLVGEAFSRLDPVAQMVMQALALYSYPVTPAAVDYLLLPYRTGGVDSAAVLGRLVNMQFVRREAGWRYFLHPVDRAYALSRVPKGEENDRYEPEAPPFTQFALLHRAADYLAQTRTPRETWKGIEDLGPQMQEFELRYAGEDYDAAANVLLEIDEYLLAWQHYDIVAETHGRLQGKIRNRNLNDRSVARLNQAFKLTGRIGSTLQHTFRDSTDGITRLAWLHDSKALVSASIEGIVRVWDVSEEVVRQSLLGHHDQVLDVAVSADDKHVISASVDNTLKIWDLRTDSVLHTLVGHSDSVTAVAVSSNDLVLSGSKDQRLKVWDLSAGSETATLVGHTSDISAVAVTPDGRSAISASWDATIKVWDLRTSRERFTCSGHTGPVKDVAVLLQARLIASAGSDHSVRLWSLDTGQQLNVLEGPRAPITRITVAPDCRFLAASLANGDVWIWRSDTWEPVSILAEQSHKDSVSDADLAFAWDGLVLASTGEGSSAIRIWDLDRDVLLSRTPEQEITRYATAKVALVGDSSVGKTSLGWRLKYGAFQEQPTTHGQNFWLIDALRTVRPDQTACEVVLWDLAGQKDYRLTHALFLEDVDLALVLFNPNERPDTLQGAEYWLKHLVEHEGPQARTILVGTQIDRGKSIWTQEELEAFCTDHGVTGGYVGTSALSGEGIADLIAHIQDQLPWEDKPPTVTPKIFSAIKEAVIRERERTGNAGEGAHDRNLPLIIAPEQLSQRLSAMNQGSELKFTYEDMMTAVRHLAKHGYVSVLRRSAGQESMSVSEGATVSELSAGPDVILLVPDLLNNLAASLIQEARRDRRNLGVLNEARLLSGDYTVPELANLEKNDRETLLDAVAGLFLKHNLCLRKTVGTEALLIFPSLISQKQPLLRSAATRDDITFAVSGSVETVYPSLAVQLGYSQFITRTEYWQNQAQFELGPGEVCGFRLVERQEGEIELVLYYGPETSEPTRLIFRGLFEKFLTEHQVSISKYLPVTCPVCETLQDRSVVIRRMRAGKDYLGCEECGTRLDIAEAHEEIRLDQSENALLDREQARTSLRTNYETGLVRIKRLIHGRGVTAESPSCYISYAWDEPEQELWVFQLVEDLRKVGIKVVFDQTDNFTVGSSITRFVNLMPSCDFVLVVGTPLYKYKYENPDPNQGYYLAAEGDLIDQRLSGSEAAKKSVLPLLLAGDVEESFPPLLHGRKHTKFTHDGDYLIGLFQLIVTMYGLSIEDDEIRTQYMSLVGDKRRAGV